MSKNRGAGGFYGFLHRHPKWTKFLLIVVTAIAFVAMMFLMALLCPFAFWIVKNRTDAGKHFWGFWEHFFLNLGLGAIIGIAFGIFFGTIYGYSVWIPKLWKKRKERGCCGRFWIFFGAISLILIGIAAPGFIFECFAWSPFDNWVAVWVPAAMQGGIFMIHFFIKYLYRGMNKKLKKIIDKKVGVEMQSIEPGAQPGALPAPRETDQPRNVAHIVQIEGEI